MPLLAHQQRTARNQEKTTRILRFLRTTIYSTAQILGEVMGVKSPSAISETLHSMEKKRLIRHQAFRELGGTFTLWGITSVGQAAALQNGDDPTNVVFNSSKVSLATLQHYLSLQSIRVRAEQKNWSNFLYCDRRALDKTKPDDCLSDPQRPDLLATDPAGRRVAIESERTLKRLPRYKENVIPGHVRRINADEYQYVVWICRHAQDEKTLRDLLTTAICELSNENALRLEKTAPGVKTFNITNLNSWPTV